MKYVQFFSACNATIYCDIGCLKHNGRVERRQDPELEKKINLNDEFDRNRIFSNGIVTPECMHAVCKDNIYENFFVSLELHVRLCKICEGLDGIREKNRREQGCSIKVG